MVSQTLGPEGGNPSGGAGTGCGARGVPLSPGSSGARTGAGFAAFRTNRLTYHLSDGT